MPCHGYWEIVTGLVVLVATFFVCIRSVYSDTERPSSELRCPADRPVETAQGTSAGSRLAAWESASSRHGLRSNQIVRCHMVEIIGFVTIGALIWVLAWSMAGESAAEQKRTKRTTVAGGVAKFANVETNGTQARRAA